LPEEPDVAILERAREQTGMSLDELWVNYFGLGGKAGPVELEAFVRGLLKPDSYQYNVIAHALNERFMSQGRDHPVHMLDGPDACPRPCIARERGVCFSAVETLAIPTGASYS
jgi:hypothetical protein